MILILDYGMGNAASIKNMVSHVGGEAIISSDPEEILKARAIILPGVGAFDNAMSRLNSSNLLNALQTRVLSDGVPFLGICLGMQLLFERSEEGGLPGLGFIPGEVKRFNFKNSKLKVPHMGWNIVHPKENHRLFKGDCEESRFYFVHSYHAVCSHLENVVATTNYGYSFACVVQKDNIIGAQFHPEKSHKFGMTFFKNFLDSL